MNETNENIENENETQQSEFYDREPITAEEIHEELGEKQEFESDCTPFKDGESIEGIFIGHFRVRLNPDFQSPDDKRTHGYQIGMRIESGETIFKWASRGLKRSLDESNVREMDEIIVSRSGSTMKNTRYIVNKIVRE